MITGVACNCHGSPSLFRQFLFECKTPNYMAVPLLQGEKGKAFLESNGFTDALTYANNHSAYVLIVGVNASTSEWADINNATPDRQLKAEMILERFAS